MESGGKWGSWAWAGNSISQVLISSHSHVITAALPVKAGSFLPFLLTNPKPSILSRCLVAMETPLLFEAALDFTLCLRALCFRSCIPPPTANLWEVVLLGRPLKPSLSLNQSQGCDQKNRRAVTWLISHKKFSRPFLLQLHIRRGGEGRFYDSLHFTNETSLHSFSQLVSKHISTISLFMTGFCKSRKQILFLPSK